MSYNLDRFLSCNSHVDHERPPVAFLRVHDQVSVEDTALMRARLEAFDQHFSSSTNHSRN
ncbi:hypothetical protein HDV62DRAFT_374279 [Trichoderma sp. SZMC 28011]